MNKFLGIVLGALILVSTPSYATDVSGYDVPGFAVTDNQYCIPGVDGGPLSNQGFVDTNESSGSELIAVFANGTTEFAASELAMEVLLGPKPDDLKIMYYSLWNVAGNDFLVAHGNPCAVAYTVLNSGDELLYNPNEGDNI